MLKRSTNTKRWGAVLPLVTILLILLVGMLAFAIDIGYIRLVQTELQNAADASAIAAATKMVYNKPASYQTSATLEAESCASLNLAGSKAVQLAKADVEYGNWDSTKRIFTKDKSPVNSVRVLARRDTTNTHGPVDLFFGKLLGLSKVDLTAQSIAVIPSGGVGTKFLLDDEMFDTDVKVIENLAAKAKKTAEDLLSDKDGDWFIDMYKYVAKGTKIELPTGQIGDEAMFDIEANVGTTRAKFPFNENTLPSLKDFLNYNEDSSSWRYNLIPKSKLDPLPGVGRWNNPSRYASLVNPDFVHVSPLFKSDVSALDGVGEPVNNGVNALGLRRGLVAFKIVGVGADPDGSGSVLPNLIIELVDPATINLDTVQIGMSETGRIRLVQ